jgi:hypothetical protein
MKVKLLVTLFYVYGQFCFSQTVKGKVVFNNYSIPNVEIVNSTSKSFTTSDTNGLFSILAKPNDVLVFVAKVYEIKSLTITSKMITENNLDVTLVLKAEELKEIFINNQPSIKLGADTKWEQGKLDQYTLEKNTQRLNVVGVNKHTIDNGMDFMRIGKMIGSLFKKEKDSVPNTKKSLRTNFIIEAKNNFDTKFFIGTLKLKPEQIDLFLQFCDTDPKSKTLIQDSNALAMMEFLIEKNTAFKN